jgi:uncharacterized protein with PIN domain
MPHSADIYFHGSLNDFLRPVKRETWVRYSFSGNPAVKDAIEAIGVPHPEVWEVVVNGSRVDWLYQLQHGDRVEVYPFDGQEEELVKDLQAYRFVLDVHLGTLARALRLLGFDTYYTNDLTDKDIAALAAAAQRIVLTRDVNLLKQNAIVHGYWLRSQHTAEQLAEVVRRYRLINQVKPFVRCLVCNGSILEVRKEAVLDQLPPKTQHYFHEFYQCSSCRRVYWKGSHYERMQEMVRRIREKEG